ncbi:MAG: cobyrinate a,c-diamide synthase [Propionibacteriaceae bacterium]|nr:cobyrinate a,c-diamide synthase [Propionibacteriaceae bacterium]
MAEGRLLVTGPRSGGGKTAVTVAVLAALKARGLSVVSFKCGPDYIDPMFHRAALGVPSHNLDLYFCPPAALAAQLAERGGGAVSVIEGAMGYYDGIGGSSRASAFEVAQATGTPAVLVLDARGMAASAGALVQGFVRFRTPSGLCGVIVNQAAPTSYPLVAEAIRQAGSVPLGFLPRCPQAAWPSRHLGLVAAAEIGGLDAAVAELARLAEEHIDLDGLLRLARTAPPLTAPAPPLTPLPAPASAPPPGQSVKLAVARDEAFCFAYAETLELFERLGCRIVFFSPLRDAAVPDCDALYLPGGYPENHTAALSGNIALASDIRERIGRGLPTLAECGGFMYLHHDIDGAAMAGVIAGSISSTDRLQRFGYAALTARRDNLLCRAGETLPAHEFHYCASSAPGDDFDAVKASTQAAYRVGHASATLYAGFPHLYLPAVPRAAERFTDSARRFSKARLDGATAAQSSEPAAWPKTRLGGAAADPLSSRWAVTASPASPPKAIP